MISNKKHSDLPQVLPRICDFGLATEFKSGQRLKQSVGKCGYWSQECEIGNYDGKKNDVWCLGVSLFLMLIGGPPYGRIYDKAYYTMYDQGPGGLGRLVNMYERSHLMPEHALALLGSMFSQEQYRSSMTRVLESRWMLE